MAGKNKSSKKAKAKVAAKKKIYQVEKDKEPKKKSDQEDRTNREEEVPCEEEKNVGDDESVSLERQKETPDPLDECPELIPGSAVTSEDVKAEAKVEKDVNMNLAKQLNRMTDTTTENMDGKGSNAAVTHCTETPTKPFAHSILSPNAKPFSLKPTPQVVEITTVSPAADEDGGVMEAGSKVAKIVKTTVPATRYLDTKHPLRYKWTLWHFFHYPNTNWEDNQRMVLAVEYVEDFFGLLNWVKSCSELGHGHEYSFFKEDIKP